MESFSNGIPEKIFIVVTYNAAASFKLYPSFLPLNQFQINESDLG